MAIFQKSVIKKHLNNLDKEQVGKAYLKFKKNYNPSKIEEIKTLKEEEYQDGFLRDIFVDVFGYSLKPEENYTLVREFKNQSDSKKADGAILKDKKAIAVIELKSSKTKDLYKVTQQAFNYKNNQPECKYVITSNFQKLRFYIDYANEYEEFDLFKLQKKDFELLYLILNKESIFNNLPLKLKEETKFHEQEISDKLYNDYSHFKSKLYENLSKNHPEKDKLTLFKKSQKLIDRFLFILFAEDSGLLPPNSISRVIETFNKLDELDAYKPIYEIFKQYFGYMNIGRKGKTPADDIPAYNGGLFYPDTLLDNLNIDDKILIDDLKKLSTYDFSTEVDVNILGHIFEHSLSEIEEITAEIESAREHAPLRKEKTISKRKKDGVFYTPKYITQYIVENTVGTLCLEKRQELQLEEIEFDGTYKAKTGKLSAKGKKLFKTLETYKQWLQSLKIIDPACGSGAFLNQALNFLIAEHKTIDDIIAELTNTPMRLFDVDKSILENNLFGVDINEESVEIAQLSLWLRTAQKGRKLSSLNNNIKCGNSLIDDPAIAGNKAFHWQTEFPQIFKEKNKKAYHITTAIHDSRTSARMKKYKVRERREMGTNPYPNIIYFTKEDDLLITQTIAQIVKEDKLNMLAYNICADHIHLLLVCDIDEVPKIMQKIKSVSSKLVDRMHNTREHAPLRKKKKPLWQQKYSSPKEVTSQDQLQNTLSYIQKNRSKHELPEHSKEIKLLIENMCIDFETAIKPEYTGGFDCVIGNPPYVQSSIEEKEKNFYTNTYLTNLGKPDLYRLFIQKGIELTRKNGKFSFITPNSFLTIPSAKLLRTYIKEQASLSIIVNYEGMVFQDANINTVIFIINKNNSKKEIAIINDISENPSIVTLTEAINNSAKLSYDSYYKEDIINIDYSNNSTFKLTQKVGAIKNKLFNSAKYTLGLQVYHNSLHSKELIKERHYHNYTQLDQTYIPEIGGKNIARYSINIQNSEYVSLGEWCYNKPDDFYLKGDRIFIREIPSSKHLICTLFSEVGVPNKAIIIVKSEKINIKYLLGLLNSKLIGFYIHKTTEKGKQKLFPRISLKSVRNIPIAKVPTEAQQPFIQKAEIMLELNQQLQKKSNKFLNRTKDNFEIEKISKKLGSFYNYDFKTFVAELKKQKVTLSLKQQDEWQDYFDSYKTEINQLQNEIQQTDNEIDKMVYELYGLNEKEIAIIEKSV